MRTIVFKAEGRDVMRPVIVLESMRPMMPPAEGARVSNLLKRAGRQALGALFSPVATIVAIACGLAAMWWHMATIAEDAAAAIAFMKDCAMIMPWVGVAVWREFTKPTPNTKH